MIDFKGSPLWAISTGVLSKPEVLQLPQVFQIQNFPQWADPVSSEKKFLKLWAVLEVGEWFNTIEATEKTWWNNQWNDDNLRAIISTLFSLLSTEMSSRLEPQQLSFLTLDISLTLVRATIMSSVSFTILQLEFFLRPCELCRVLCVIKTLSWWLLDDWLLYDYDAPRLHCALLYPPTLNWVQQSALSPQWDHQQGAV